jgi:hypothetical protein
MEPLREERVVTLQFRHQIREIASGAGEVGAGDRHFSSRCTTRSSVSYMYLSVRWRWISPGRNVPDQWSKIHGYSALLFFDAR